MTNIKLPKRRQDSNKGTFGKVLNICGSENYIGAAFLSTKAALKIGAGFSALATSQRVINSISSALPEAVYLTREIGLRKINEFSVVLIGCGLGLDKNSKKILQKTLSRINPDKPIVIDADGLNILAKNPKLNKLLENKKRVIITPHVLEAARLLGVTIEEVLSDIEFSAKELTRKYHCTTILKNHKTIIYSKDGQIYQNTCGNSSLAKSGTGDVLAGFLAGLLAQDMDDFEAAKTTVYLHARAGEFASKELSEYSVLASDLFKYLPKAIAEISCG